MQLQLSHYRSGLSRQTLLVAILFIGIFTMAVRAPADTDTWWHIRSGQYIFENRLIPLADPFSHTQAGQLWIDHSWLAQLFWYGLYAAGGWPTVALGLAVLVTLAFWLAWQQMKVNVFVGAFAMILGAIVSSVIWTARPQMITFVLVALTATLLDRFKRAGGRLLPWLPLVMLVWVNMHGGFAVGFMLMLTYLAGEVMNRLTGHTEDPVATWPRLRYLLVTIILSLAVVAVNPHTWRMWLYPFQTVGIGALRDFIQEWQSPNFHLSYVQPFALMLVLTLIAMARTGRRADWTDLGLVLLWTMWSLFAARNVALFGLVVTPILARYADLAWLRQWQVWGYDRVPFAGRPGSRPLRFEMVLNWLLLGLVILAAVAKIAGPLDPASHLKDEQAGLPYRAAEFMLARRPPGPMFNSYNWGGYLIFKLWPDYPVYIDGRTDLYDDRFIRQYLDITLAETGWQQRLDDQGIKVIFIENDSTLDRFLRRESRWHEAYRDDQAVIFVRNTAP